MTAFPWLSKPWQHQKDAWERATKVPNYAFFFEMGTGKTFTTINVLRYRYGCAKRVLRTLVIAPAVALENWRREFQKGSKVGKQVAVLKGSQRR